MFTRDRVAVRIANIVPELMEKDDAEISLLKITCEINPLTPELAAEIHDFVRATLFTMSGAEVNSLLSSAAFALAVPPQCVAFRMAPDVKKPSFTIEEAKIGGFKARRSKKSSAWTWTFTITCSPASDHQLGQIMECYTRSRYITLAPATPGLFDETPAPASRGLTQTEMDAQDAEDDSDLVDHEPALDPPAHH
jgi:hypothetical protein